VAESALIVPVPEIETLVGPLREKFDPTAALGVPAHITVIHPFIPPERITSADVERVRRVAKGTPSFRFRLVAAKCFPDALYLEPEPLLPFVALTRSVVREYPQHPPYEGRYASIIPHVTVARGDAELLCALQRQLAADARLQAGVEAKCVSLVLIEKLSGHWCERHVFQLESDAETDG
jgi:2'-5' RNA ligase